MRRCAQDMYVETGDRGKGGPLRDPVGHDEPLESELSLEDLVEGTVVLARKDVIDKVWYKDMQSIYARH